MNEVIRNLNQKGYLVDTYINNEVDIFVYRRSGIHKEGSTIIKHGIKYNMTTKRVTITESLKADDVFNILLAIEEAISQNKTKEKEDSNMGNGYFNTGRTCPKCGSPMMSFYSNDIGEEWCTNDDCSFTVNKVMDRKELAEMNNISIKTIENFYNQAI